MRTTQSPDPGLSRFDQAVTEAQTRLNQALGLCDDNPGNATLQRWADQLRAELGDAQWARAQANATYIPTPADAAFYGI